MIEFPETAQTEWRIIADAANAADELRKRIALDTRAEQELDKLRVRHIANTAFQAEINGAATPTLDMTTLNDYQAVPNNAPVDLIEGVLKDNGVLLFLGPAESGKSTSALQMCYSLHTGQDWMGQPVKPVNGGFGIMSYDMDASLLFDWMNGYPNVDPRKFSVVNAYKRGHPLAVPALRAQIASAWRAMQVEVVMIDSFSASFFGQDQNDAAAVQAHYRDLRLFALTEVGARAMIVIVHSTDSNPHKARGSSVHHDVGDTIISQWAEPNTRQRHLRMVKYRAARGQEQMGPAVLTKPDDVTHLVSLDIAGMALAGMHLPASAGAMAFPDLPDTFEEPDTDSDSGEEDDDL